MATPYYRDDAVTLYHGDCLEVLEWLEADVLVTDPPYGIDWSTHGISRTSHSNRLKGRFDGRHAPTRRIEGDKSTAVRDAALSLWLPKPSLVFGSLLLAPPQGTRHVAAYVKPLDSGSLTGYAHLRRDVEAIYLLGESEHWRNRRSADSPRSALPQHRRPPSKWRSSIFATTWRLAGTSAGLAATSGHPHAKPTDVLRDLINLHPGVVADPFAGSGSTLRAAKDLGRRAVGIERDERYCEIAARRLAQEVLAL